MAGPTTTNHDYLSEFTWISQNEKKCLVILAMTLAMMGVELVFGYLTHSMALLADGWHMGSHAGALFITYLTYVLAKSPRLRDRFSFGTGKFIPLGGYTNAILLGIMAVWMGVESLLRFRHPEAINYDEALLVSVIGLLVNLVSAFILGKGSHFHAHSHADEEHADADHGHGHLHQSHDHAQCDHADANLKSAYFHVLADALTSILAIVALFFGKIYNYWWLDASMGVVGAIVILRWSYSLTKEAAWELLDGHARSVSREKVTAALEAMGTEVIDLHFWSIGPRVNACEVVLKTTNLRGPAPYKKLMQETFGFRHVVVEEWGT